MSATYQHGSSKSFIRHLRYKTRPGGKSLNLESKLHRLEAILREMDSLLVAYSGGVDSTFLLKVAKDVLGDRVVAATARSFTYPESEYCAAHELAQWLGVKHVTLVSEELEILGFCNNPVDRCYYCKSELFSKLKQVALELRLEHVVDGSNADDARDYRPGMRAAVELGVRSPLREAELTKADIRELSQQMSLPTWDKPSLACLASRFPYGDHITRDALQMVGKAEEHLLGLGFRQVRVRHHRDIARIEVDPPEIGRLLDERLRCQVVTRLKEIGYKYAAIDLEGYRSGSMNEVLGVSSLASQES